MAQRAHGTLRLVMVAAACATLMGCGGYVGRGTHLYREGRYIESAEVLARYEGVVGQEPPKRQAQYATYRGLTSLRLGDYADAHRWMVFAYEVVRRHPPALRPEHRRELDRGWWELMSRLPSPPPGGMAPSPAQ